MFGRLLSRGRSRRAQSATPLTPVDSDGSVDRRAMLRYGGLAAAGVAGGTIANLMNAAPAGATTGTMVYGTTMDEGSAITVLQGQADTVFEAKNSGTNGMGLYAIGAGFFPGVKS